MNAFSDDEEPAIITKKQVKGRGEARFSQSMLEAKEESKATESGLMQVKTSQGA